MFWRLKCHACGQRSSYSKGSGIDQFQCEKCQAWTYLDSLGEYTDPPSEAIGGLERNIRRQRRRPVAAPEPQQIVFCNTCLRHQQLYQQLLADYLPDEEDPRYAQYERDLPKYKADLEKRYPQICQDCAPKAQSRIHHADYYSMTNNTSRLLGRSRAGRRSMSPEPVRARDTPEKFVMRTILGFVGISISLSAILQCIWHTYGVMELQQDFGSRGRWTDDQRKLEIFSHDGLPTTSQCLEGLKVFRFTYPCYQNVGGYVSWSLLVSVALIWYNPGLRQLYSSSVRIESVSGWRSHIACMVFVLVARLAAYYYLADVFFLGNTSVTARCAAHVAAIAVIALGHTTARRSIELERWRLRGSIMPRPEERDVLSQYAGPAKETFAPQASLVTPSELLARDPQRFSIESLAPRRRGANPISPMRLPPSPPGSDPGDPMDIEPMPPAQQSTFATASFGRSTGWDPVRTNLFSIDDELRSRQEQTRTGMNDDKHMYFQPKPSVFKGRLPQAPMSQERKMRNPVTQPSHFKDVPAPQRQDFLQQMRAGIDKGKGFQRQASVESDASELQSASSRTRGQLNLAKSDWHLPEDVDKATGLEDIFGGSFNIGDHTNSASVTVTPAQKLSGLPCWSLYIGGALGLTVLGLTFDVGGMRRHICLYLVRIMEQFGY